MLGAVAAAAMSMTSHAATIQLGFVLDGSGSISAAEWNIIRNGLASAINLIPFGGQDTYEVSVVQFSTGASSYAQASNILITDATSRTNLSTFIAGLGQLGGSTNYQAGFATMQAVLGNTIGQAAFSYVNFATDGAPNTCTSNPPGNPGGFSPAQWCGMVARNNLIASGVDNISVEGIGVTPGNATFLQNQICHPTPCDTTNPYDFPTHGFYIGVSNAAEYAAAIQNKVRVVTGQTPEPGTIALVGLALAGLGVTRRRKEAKAA
jgi:hypothetical protein